MEITKRIMGALGLVMLSASPTLAAPQTFTANPILDGIISTVVYSFIGIVMATLAYKIVDMITPGNLGEDIAKDSVALAILAGMKILGICIIIAAVLAS